MNDKIDYTLITETPGTGATTEQKERLYQRYHFGRKFAKHGNVLEIACGSGIGLSYLAKEAKSVIGSDIEKNNVLTSRKISNQSPNVSTCQMDAHKLPFADNSIDLILIYEALYYFNDPTTVISETHRVLSSGGTLVISTVNREWEDFHPSIYTSKYHSASELHSLLKGRYLKVNIYCGFMIKKGGLKNALFSFIKRLAVDFNLIPGSLKARAYLKRIFIGKISPLPDRLTENMVAYEEPVLIDATVVNKDYKVLYAVANKG